MHYIAMDAHISTPEFAMTNEAGRITQERGKRWSKAPCNLRAIVCGFALVLIFAAQVAAAGGHTHHTAPRMAENEAFAQATAALERYRDVSVAKVEGYIHTGDNDGFMMGEHWVQPIRLESGECVLTRPTYLQYLRIDDKRTLIGTGYVCDLEVMGEPPQWFGPGVVWHLHGPELCQWRKGVFMDFRYWAQALPNVLTDLTWETLCQRWRGTPRRRKVTMLHTWNWIAHPDGSFAHENRAIPFLRAGLKVRSQEFLDSETGQATLDTLQLAHGDAERRYRGAFSVASASVLQRRRAKGIMQQAESKGRKALELMREGEGSNDPGLYASGARMGAAALVEMHRNLASVFSPDQQRAIAGFLASLKVQHH